MNLTSTLYFALTSNFDGDVPPLSGDITVSDLAAALVSIFDQSQNVEGVNGLGRFTDPVFAQVRAGELSADVWAAAIGQAEDQLGNRGLSFVEALGQESLQALFADRIEAPDAGNAPIVSGEDGQADIGASVIAVLRTGLGDDPVDLPNSPDALSHSISEALVESLTNEQARVGLPVKASLLLQFAESGDLSPNVLAEAIAGAINSSLPGGADEGQVREDLVAAFGRENLEALRDSGRIDDAQILQSFASAIGDGADAIATGPTGDGAEAAGPDQVRSLEFTRAVGGDDVTITLAVYVSEAYRSVRSSTEIEVDLQSLRNDLNGLFDTPTGQAIFADLSTTIGNDGRPATVGELARQVEFSGLSSESAPLPDSANLLIALEPRITDVPEAAVGRARAFNGELAEVSGEGSFSLIQLDPRFDRGLATSETPFLFRQVALASEQIAGQAGQATEAGLRATENQIRSELGLPPVFERGADRAIVDAYVGLFESEIAGLAGLDADIAATRTTQAQDSLGALFLRATAEQRADIASAVLERYDVTQNSTLLGVLDQNRADVQRIYAQGALSADGEVVLNTLYQQLSAAQIADPDNFPTPEFLEVEPAVLRRLALEATSDPQIATVTVGDNDQRTTVSQPAGFEHETVTIGVGEDLAQPQRLQLQALEVELANWIARSPADSSQAGALDALRKTVADVLGGAVTDTVSIVTSRSGEGALASASFYSHSQATNTVTLTDNVVDPDSLLELQSRPVGSFVDADASNRLAVLRSVAENYPAAASIGTETENPREIAGLQQHFFVLDEVLFRQPSEGYAEARTSLLRRQGEVLVAASADLASIVAADQRGLTDALRSEIQDLNQRLQALDLDALTVGQFRELGGELGLAVNRARYSSTGDVEQNLGFEARKFGNTEAAIAADNGVTRGDYVIYEQITADLGLVDAETRSRAGSAQDFVEILSQQDYSTEPVQNALEDAYATLEQPGVEVNGFAQGLVETFNGYESSEALRQQFQAAQGEGNVARLQESGAVVDVDVVDSLDSLLPPVEAVSAFTRVSREDGSTSPISDIQIVLSEDLISSRSDAELNGIVRKVEADLNAFFNRPIGQTTLTNLQAAVPGTSISNISELAGLTPGVDRALPGGTKVVIYLEDGFASPNGNEFARAVPVDTLEVNHGDGSASVIRLNADYDSGVRQTNATLLYREVFSAADHVQGESLSTSDFLRIENQIRSQFRLPPIQEGSVETPVVDRAVADRLGFENEFAGVGVTFGENVLNDGTVLPQGRLGREFLATTSQGGELGFPLLSLTSDTFDSFNDLEIVTAPLSLSANRDADGFTVRSIILEEIARIPDGAVSIEIFVQRINDRVEAELGSDGAARYRLDVLDSAQGATLAFNPDQDVVSDPAAISRGAVQTNISIRYDALGDPNSGLSDLYRTAFGEDPFGQIFSRAQRIGSEIAEALTDQPSGALRSFFTQLVNHGAAVSLPVDFSPDEVTDSTIDGFNRTDKTFFPILPRVSLEDVVASVLSDGDIEKLRGLSAEELSSLSDRVRAGIEFASLGRADTDQTLNFFGYDQRFERIFETALNARVEEGAPFRFATQAPGTFVSPLNGRDVIDHTIGGDGGTRLPAFTNDGNVFVVAELRFEGPRIQNLFNNRELWSLDNEGIRSITKLQQYDTPLGERLIFEDFIRGLDADLFSAIRTTAGQFIDQQAGARVVADFEALSNDVAASLRAGDYAPDLIDRFVNLRDDISAAAGGQPVAVAALDQSDLGVLRSYRPAEPVSLEAYQELARNFPDSTVRGATGTATDVQNLLARIAELPDDAGLTLQGEIGRTLTLLQSSDTASVRVDSFASGLAAYADGLAPQVRQNFANETVGADGLRFLGNAATAEGTTARIAGLEGITAEFGASLIADLTSGLGGNVAGLPSTPETLAQSIRTVLVASLADSQARESLPAKASVLLNFTESGHLSPNIVAEAIAGAVNSSLLGAVSEGQARQALVNAFGQEKLEALRDGGRITDAEVLQSFAGAIREQGPGGGRQGPTQTEFTDFIESVYADTARFIRDVLDTPATSVEEIAQIAGLRQYAEAELIQFGREILLGKRTGEWEPDVARRLIEFTQEVKATTGRDFSIDALDDGQVVPATPGPDEQIVLERAFERIEAIAGQLDPDLQDQVDGFRNGLDALAASEVYRTTTRTIEQGDGSSIDVPVRSGGEVLNQVQTAFGQLVANINTHLRDSGQGLLDLGDGLSASAQRAILQATPILVVDSQPVSLTVAKVTDGKDDGTQQIDVVAFSTTVPGLVVTVPSNLPEDDFSATLNEGIRDLNLLRSSPSGLAQLQLIVSESPTHQGLAEKNVVAKVVFDLGAAHLEGRATAEFDSENGGYVISIAPDTDSKSDLTRLTTLVHEAAHVIQEISGIDGTKSVGLLDGNSVVVANDTPEATPVVANTRRFEEFAAEGVGRFAASIHGSEDLGGQTPLARISANTYAIEQGARPSLTYTTENSTRFNNINLPDPRAIYGDAGAAISSDLIDDDLTYSTDTIEILNAVGRNQGLLRETLDALDNNDLSPEARESIEGSFQRILSDLVEQYPRAINGLTNPSSDAPDGAELLSGEIGSAIERFATTYLREELGYALVEAHLPENSQALENAFLQLQEDALLRARVHDGYTPPAFVPLQFYLTATPAEGETTLEAYGFRSDWIVGQSLPAYRVSLNEEGYVYTRQIPVEGNITVLGGEDFPDAIRASLNLPEGFQVGDRLPGFRTTQFENVIEYVALPDQIVVPIGPREASNSGDFSDAVFRIVTDGLPADIAVGTATPEAFARALTFISDSEGFDAVAPRLASTVTLLGDNFGEAGIFAAGIAAFQGTLDQPQRQQLLGDFLGTEAVASFGGADALAPQVPIVPSAPDNAGRTDIGASVIAALTFDLSDDLRTCRAHPRALHKASGPFSLRLSSTRRRDRPCRSRRRCCCNWRKAAI